MIVGIESIKMFKIGSQSNQTLSKLNDYLNPLIRMNTQSENTMNIIDSL